ncbi:MAG TPA: hypothetical protein PKA03_00200 [Tabrizicola sp.]|nr:hypothetical protein [Tabrizicola sp.]
MLPLLQTTAIDGAEAANNLAGLDALIGTAAVLFAMFLVVATVAEQILELFRGTVEQLTGITMLKSGITLEQAQKIAVETLPAEGTALAKVNALVAMGEQFPKTLEAKKAEIEALRANIATALGPDLTGTVETQMTSSLTALTAEVKTMVQSTESARVYLLRLLSCIVCIVLCILADFNAFQIAAEDLGRDLGVLSTGLGTVLTGFAAASGSSYWHDALDKIRAAKSSIGQMKAVASI